MGLITKAKKIVTVEEGLLNCGIGSLIGTCLIENHIKTKFLRIGINDHFA